MGILPQYGVPLYHILFYLSIKLSPFFLHFTIFDLNPPPVFLPAGVSLLKSHHLTDEVRHPPAPKRTGHVPGTSQLTCRNCPEPPFHDRGRQWTVTNIELCGLVRALGLSVPDLWEPEENETWYFYPVIPFLRKKTVDKLKYLRYNIQAFALE